MNDPNLNEMLKKMQVKTNNFVDASLLQPQLQQ